MPAFALIIAASTAALPTMNTTLPVSGLVCNGNQTAFVVRPNDKKTYPLIAFAHGLNAWNVKAWFPQLLEGMAAEGFVVVAPMAGTGWCGKQSEDQV